MRQTMREEFEHSLRRHADRVAVEYGSNTWTYRDLDRWSTAVGQQLLQSGVGQCDVVAIYTRNCPEFLVVDLAIAKLGALKLPVNVMLPASTVKHALYRAGARLLVSGTSVATAADEATADLSDLVRIEVDDGAGELRADLTVLEQLPQPDAMLAALPATTHGGDDPAALYFTGGTTGKPKGVLHSQSSTVALHYAQLLEAEIGQEERLLLMTPLAHAAGLFAQSALIRGACCVLVDGFDAERAVQLFEDSAITWTFLVPTMIYRILDVIDSRVDFTPSLRTVVYGAAPISPRRLEEALDRFGPVFVQLYGQTESPNWGTRLAKSDHDPARPELLGSCGQASIAADVAIVDTDGARVESGEVGEIWLRTPYLLAEYVDDPEATAEKFLDGGIRTGDIGVIDERGYLYLRDRKNDMVISGGMNVYCREVEDVLGRHPSVAVVAVIGIPHEDWGESVHAVVVPSGPDFCADALLEWCRPQLASYSRPKSVDVVDALPVTPFGKVDKKVLRQGYWAGRDRGIG